MNKSLVAVMTTAALTLGVPGIAGAKDKDTCGPHTLKGEYLLSASGFTRMSPDPTWVPKAILELIQFNGDGITVATPAITIANPLNNTGAVLERIPGSTGTYTLDPETCLGMITFPDGPQWRLYVSPAGDEFWMIQTAGLQGTQNVLEGRAKRIR